MLKIEPENPPNNGWVLVFRIEGDRIFFSEDKKDEY